MFASNHSRADTPGTSINIRPTAAALTALIMAHGLATGARAADSLADTASETPTELPKLEVSDTKPKTLASPKFTEPLRDTPQTIIAIPSTVYQQQGAMTLSDVLRNTSGITFAAGEGGSATSTAGDSFYLRGYDTSNNIFIDGVRDVGAYSRDVFNLDQVEIAKGAAGADIGRGGAAGYVNLATKIPLTENFFAGQAIYGFDEQTSGSRRRSTIDYNQTLPTSPVAGTAVRLNLMVQDNDGVGRDYTHNRSWGVAPSLALGLGTPNRAIFTAQRLEQQNRPDYGLPSALLPGYAGTPATPAVDWSTFFGYSADFDQVHEQAYEARLEHDFSADLKITNQTRFSSVERTAVATTPGQSAAAYVPATGLLTRSRQANKRDTDILSNQTNINGTFNTGAAKHDFSAGVELTNENAYSPAFVSVTEPAISIQSPNPNGTPAGTPARSGAYTNANTRTGAAYVFDTVHFGERWLANASLRAEDYKTDYLSVPATGANTAVTASHGIVSWKTGLVYKPVPAGSLYAAYSNSLTPPGNDFTLSSAVGNQNNPDTTPQKTTNAEAGVKWDFFNGHLGTTLAVFRAVNDKTVFTDPILGAIPAGKQTVQGIELGATRRITDNWLIIASVSYLDSEINSGTTTGNNLAGAALPLIPKYSGNIWSSYRTSKGIIFGGGAQYSSSIQRRDASVSNAPRSVPDYWVFNALASYPITKQVSLRLNVNNLFDEKYISAYNNNGARFNPGAPRSYLLSADFRF